MKNKEQINLQEKPLEENPEAKIPTDLVQPVASSQKQKPVEKSPSYPPQKTMEQCSVNFSLNDEGHKNQIDNYKILIDLLKHQDSQFNSFLTWNIILQGAILALIKEIFINKNLPFSILLPLLGIGFAIMWWGRGKRIKSYTDYYIEKLKKFEEKASTLQNFQLFRDGEKKTKSGWSKEFYFTWVPGGLILMWLCFLIISIFSK